MSASIFEDSENSTHSWSVSLKQKFKRRFPIFTWLPKYKKSDFFADLISGTTVGLTVVPQSMAYAAIANLSPEYGLYSSYIGCFLYVVLGSCKQVTIGPTAVMGLLTYETCGKSTNGATCAVLTGFYSGVFELLMAVLQLGWVVNFISEPVTIGFTAGAATTIITSQIKNLFGIDGHKGSGFVGYWKAIFKDFSTIHLGDALLGSISFVVLLLLRKLKDCKTSKTSNEDFLKTTFWLLSVSRNVIVVILTSLIAFLWANPPFKLTGNVQSGFPPVGPPQFVLPSTNSSSTTTEYYTYWETWSILGAGPLVLALISVLQNVAISKAFGSGQTVDATQEMLALGIINSVGGFVSSMPVSGSFSRSAVNQASGVRSPLGGFFTGILVLLSIGFLTPSFFYIPKSSLAAVIIAAVMFLIDFEAIIPMWKVCKLDVAICAATYLFAIFFGMEYGILIGVAVSLLILLIRSIKLKVHSEIVIDDLTGLQYLLVKPDSGLTFTSVDHIRTSIIKLVMKYAHVNVIAISFQNLRTYDYTITKMVMSLINEVEKTGKVIILLDCNKHWEDVFASGELCCNSENLSRVLQTRFPHNININVLNYGLATSTLQQTSGQLRLDSHANDDGNEDTGEKSLLKMVK